MRCIDGIWRRKHRAPSGKLGSDWKRLAECVGFKFLGTEQINKRVRGNAELLYMFERRVKCDTVL